MSKAPYVATVPARSKGVPVEETDADVSFTAGRAEALPRRGLFPAGTVSTSYVPLKSGLSLEALLIVLSTSPAKMSSTEKSACPVEPVRNAIFPISSVAVVGVVNVEPEALGVFKAPPT